MKNEEKDQEVREDNATWIDGRKIEIEVLSEKRSEDMDKEPERKRMETEKKRGGRRRSRSRDSRSR